MRGRIHDPDVKRRLREIELSMDWNRTTPDIGAGQRDGICEVCRKVLTRQQLEARRCENHKEEKVK